MVLRGILSGLAAAAAAYFVNTYLTSRLGNRAVYTLSPAVEEILKSGLALLLAGDIFASHAVFGVLEAIHDYAASPDGINARAAVMGAASHILFGGVTVLLMRYGPGPAVFLAIVMHILYNRLMVRG